MRLREWSVVAWCLLAVACGSESSDPDGPSAPEPGSLGAPCLGEDELQTGFSSFALQETVIYELSTNCDSQVCVVNHFQGRVSCPYGQTEQEGLTSPQCFLPGSNDPVTVPVEPQLLARPAKKTVTCSCRCAGPGDGPFCACPEGLICEPVVREIGVPPPGTVEAASYCVPPDTRYDPTHPPAPDVCERSSSNCGDPRPYPSP